ncbi:uncharacterized protein N0V89_002169 [Didymosphaeria variabile]|uniref:DRBM domain-containing protein n=1 Tax=Didymosphaeria variabile TaxID=1932322 RepID=A0A9W9CEF4_9PLEO|nr:uncharacterized protein N0V89_002169 [Didymosphaeria variabile]KAJ4357593.1 hypothetical protein N0V89_002169 [Didymosphaeria variabile]
MPAGDDLLRYFIVPGKSSGNFPVSPSKSPPSSPISHSSHQEEYWRALGQLQDEPKSPTNSRKRREMEADTAPCVPAFSGPSNMPGQILSIEEFRALRQNSTPTATDALEAPQPRALAPRSSRYTIELHEKYQAYGIPRPDFVFSGDSVVGFCVRTDFLGRELRVDGSCGSKQEAKETLSEICMGVIDELEREGKLERAPKAKKQKTQTTQQEVVKKEKEIVVNYIGQLLEFRRSTASSQPTYVDYQLGQSFSCELTIDGHPSTFGDRTTYFPSKKAARQHAAGCAVKHFQAEGLWPDTYTELGGIKKVKSPPLSDSNTPTPLASTDPVDTLAGASSYAQCVAQIAAQLGLNTPEWRYAPSPAAAQGFHTVSCFFKNGGPHEGPIGEVRHVFGKKKAKEECGMLVLQYLKGVREKRMEYARGVMAGMKGDTEVVASRAVGKPAGGEVEFRTGEETSEDEGFDTANEAMD